jgi:hypothetical protein
LDGCDECNMRTWCPATLFYKQNKRWLFSFIRTNSIVKLNGWTTNVAKWENAWWCLAISFTIVTFCLEQATKSRRRTPNGLFNDNRFSLMVFREIFYSGSWESHFLTLPYQYITLEHLFSLQTSVNAQPLDFNGVRVFLITLFLQLFLSKRRSRLCRQHHINSSDQRSIC